MDPQVLMGAGAWLWENFGKDIISKAAEGLQDKWKEFKWGFAASAYRDRVREVHSKTYVLRNPKPIIFEDIYTDVYVLDTLTAMRRLGVEQFQTTSATSMSSSAQRKRQPAIDVLRTMGNLLILGKAGAGKTTFLKHVIVLAVEGKLDRIPIFVWIKEWNDTGLDLMQFIAQEFDVCGFPDATAFIIHILTSGQAIILFDGLDEISEQDNDRAKKIHEIVMFSRKYSKCQQLLTCRIAATDYDFEHFTPVEVADFDDEQVRLFVMKWFKDDTLRGQLFLRDIFALENRRLLDLSRTPLLLTLLCFTFDELVHFPARRVEIYEEGIDALLSKWDASRLIQRDMLLYKNLHLGRKLQMFARIAADTFERGEYFFRQETLTKRIFDYVKNLPGIIEDEIDAEGILRTIEVQHGIFIEQARKVYSFSHLTFQEYFAARHVKENASDENLRHLIDEHLLDTRWREVFLLTASLLDNADSFFKIMGKRVNEIISDDPRLVEVITWAKIKADRDYRWMGSPALGRAVALDIDVDRERARVSAVSLAKANSIVNTKDLHKMFERTSHSTGPLSDTLVYPPDSLIMSPGAALVEAIEREEAGKKRFAISAATALIIALARDLAFTANIDIVGKISFDDELATINSAHTLCKELCDIIGEGDLLTHLTALKAPSEDAHLKDWIWYVNKLRDASEECRFIGKEWNLSEEQVNKLRKYIGANLLLLDCLKLAYVSDRDAIEHRLLLPPK